MGEHNFKAFKREKHLKLYTHTQHEKPKTVAASKIA